MYEYEPRIGAGIIPRARPDGAEWRRRLELWEYTAHWFARRRRRLAWVVSLLIGLGAVGVVVVVWGIGESRTTAVR